MLWYVISYLNSEEETDIPIANRIKTF